MGLDRAGSDEAPARSIRDTETYPTQFYGVRAGSANIRANRARLSRPR